VISATIKLTIGSTATVGTFNANIIITGTQFP
jgi:hypothetical protein